VTQISERPYGLEADSPGHPRSHKFAALLANLDLHSSPPKELRKGVSYWQSAPEHNLCHGCHGPHFGGDSLTVLILSDVHVIAAL